MAEPLAKISLKQRNGSVTRIPPHQGLKANTTAIKLRLGD